MSPDRGAPVPNGNDAAAEVLSPPLTHVDAATASLIRLSAVIASGDEAAMRRAFADTAREGVPPAWTEEVVLQAYLFCGFPRALNAAREWRQH